MMVPVSGPTTARRTKSSLSSAERFASRDPHARIAAAALRLLFGDAYARDVGIAFWEGTRVDPSGARFVLHVSAPGALRAAFSPPIELNAARAFGAGLLDVEGDLETAIDAFYRASRAITLKTFVRMAALLRRLPPAALPHLKEAHLRGFVHSKARDRAAVSFHYDRSLEFYRTFLDRNLVYSCAYFDDAIDSLEAAQTAKLDYTLRKLRLQPGERLLDIGCGWGALVIRAAQRFGATALGITLSRLQHEEAQRRIAEAGLGERVRVELRDYRELRGERFDKIVSVGMFEHVGRSRFNQYFAAAFEALRPGGLFLNHAIADQREGRRGRRAAGFMGRFIFPDGELVGVGEALRAAECAGLEVRDVENLREHYTRTLREWRANLERNRDAAITASDESVYRLWRLYLAGSAQGFSTGRLGVFQALLARPQAGGRIELPPTRRDLYLPVSP
jgi:cyclopropane-fatty-acyl-phospholipid synthase